MQHSHAMVNAFLILVVTLGIMLYSSPAPAAPSSHVAPARFAPEPNNGSNVNVDEGQLRKAAQAFPAIREINRQALTALEAIPDPQSKQEVVAQAQSAQLKVLHQVGMEPDQYNAVIEAVRTDDGLRQKFVQILDHTPPVVPPGSHSPPPSGSQTSNPDSSNHL